MKVSILIPVVVVAFGLLLIMLSRVMIKIRNVKEIRVSKVYRKHGLSQRIRAKTLRDNWFLVQAYNKDATWSIQGARRLYLSRNADVGTTTVILELEDGRLKAVTFYNYVMQEKWQKAKAWQSARKFLTKLALGTTSYMIVAEDNLGTWLHDWNGF